MKKYGMTGRVNAQGFENKYFEIASLKEVLGRIAQRWLRVQKMAECNQSMFVEGLTDLLNFVKDLTENGMYSIVIHFSSSWSIFILLILLSYLVSARLSQTQTILKQNRDLGVLAHITLLLTELRLQRISTFIMTMTMHPKCFYYY